MYRPHILYCTPRRVGRVPRDPPRMMRRARQYRYRATGTYAPVPYWYKYLVLYHTGRLAVLYQDILVIASMVQYME